MAYAQDGLFASIQAAKAASPGLSAKELALNHGCCRQTISTVVRKQTGTSFRHWSATCRWDVAVTLLRDRPSMSITSITLAFQQSRHLTTPFGGDLASAPADFELRHRQLRPTPRHRCPSAQVHKQRCIKAENASGSNTLSNIKTLALRSIGADHRASGGRERGHPFWKAATRHRGCQTANRSIHVEGIHSSRARCYPILFGGR